MGDTSACHGYGFGNDTKMSNILYQPVQTRQRLPPMWVILVGLQAVAAALLLLLLLLCCCFCCAAVAAAAAATLRCFCLTMLLADPAAASAVRVAWPRCGWCGLFSSCYSWELPLFDGVA